jgi:hypothetical protein
MFFPLNLTSSAQSRNPQPTYVREGSNLLYIGNGFLEIQLGKASNGGIYSIVSKLTGDDYRSNKNTPATIFGISVDSNYPNATGFDNNQASSFAYNYTTSDTTSTLQFVDTFAEPYPVVVTVRITVYQNSSLSHWSISARNRGSERIDLVTFPVIYGAEKVGTQLSTNYLLMPDDFGSMLMDPYDNFVTNSTTNCFGAGTYPSFHATTQLMLFGDQAGGLYMSTYDANGYPKSFGACKDQIGSSWTMDLHVSHNFPEVPGANVSLPYDVIVGTYTGDWHSGADIYKAWALEQPWTSQGPLYQRPDVPAWFKNGFAVLKLPSYLSSGDYANPTVASSFSGIVGNVRNYLHDVNSPLLLDWWGWEKYGAWVAPDVFPPREGWASFENTVSELHSIGVHVVVSMSGGPLMTNAPGFDSKWLSCAIRNSDGSIFTITDSGKVVAWASPSCLMFQDWLVNATVTLAKAGVDGVRFDANYGYNFDFSSRLGHSSGYGDWYAQSWVALLTKVRSAVSQINLDFLLGGEHLPEIFMPFNQVYDAEGGAIGSNANLLQFGSHLISTNLFSYLYNEYAKCLSEETHVKAGVYPGIYAYFQYRQAVEATSGEVVDVAAGDVGFPQYLPITNQTRSTVWASAAFAGDFVVQGRELPPPQLSVPLMNITVGLSFNPALIRYQTPQVLVGAWQAPDGKIAIILVNLGNTTLTLPVDMGDYCSMLPANGTYSLAMFNENGFLAQPLGPTSTAQVNLPALGSVTIELAPTGAIPTTYQRYASFMLSYPGKALVDNAASFGLNEGVRTAAMSDAEGLFQAQSYPGSISEALRTLNGTVGDFERFGQLISNTTEYRTLISLAEENLRASNYLAVVSNLNLAEGLALKGLEPRFMNVLFDEKHTDLVHLNYTPQTSGFNPNYDQFTAYLDSLGRNISAQADITGQTLGKFEIAVLAVPDRPYSSQDVQNYLQFVSSGGGLLIVGSGGIPMYANSLTDHFGIHLTGGTVTATNHLWDAGSFDVTNINQSNPVTNGVVLLTSNWMAPISVSGNVVVPAWTDSASNSSSGAKGPFAFVAETTYGSGRVVYVASMLFDDCCIGGPGSEQLLSNAIAWLSQPTGIRNTVLVSSPAQQLRADAGSTQQVSFRAIWAANGSSAEGVSVVVNGTKAVTGGDGWVKVPVSSQVVSKVAYDIQSASAKEGLRILRIGETLQNVIWDRVIITLATSSVPTVGSNATITWSGYYEYDHTPFTGKITLNDSTTKDVPGTYAYTVSSIADQKYGLTIFTSNTVSIAFVQQATSTTSTTSLSTTSASSSSSMPEGFPKYLPTVVALAILAVVAVAFVFLLRRKR